MFYALAGSWEAVWEGASYPVTLPGTLDENNIGYADSGEDQRLPPGEGGWPQARRMGAPYSAARYSRHRAMVFFRPSQ